jgi:hypothetical protein
MDRNSRKRKKECHAVDRSPFRTNNRKVAFAEQDFRQEQHRLQLKRMKYSKIAGEGNIKAGVTILP